MVNLEMISHWKQQSWGSLTLARGFPGLLRGFSAMRNGLRNAGNDGSTLRRCHCDSMALQEETSVVTLKAGLVSNTVVLAALPSRVLHATQASLLQHGGEHRRWRGPSLGLLSHPPVKMQQKVPLAGLIRAVTKLLPLLRAGVGPNETASSIRGNTRKASAGIAPVFSTGQSQGAIFLSCFC